MTRFKNWIKEQWVKTRKWFKAIFSIGIVSAAGLTGIDVAQFNERPIPTRDITVAAEQVHLEQKGSVVEATMPWKGERGLKIKYDYGTPSLKERLADSRDKEVVAEKVPFSGSEGFKIDILLKEKPATNTFCYDLEGWEDYDFFYQPALTQEEIGQGISRPEEIVGSYAVYHKTLKNHVVGQTNYETGKFGHIPFPYVWEVGKEEEKIRAEDLTYNAGKLCVVVPQRFLDKADYTNGVRVDPTFGYTSVGTATAFIYNNGSDYIRGNFLALSEAGSITSITAHIQRFPVEPISGTVQFGLYASSTTGSRLGQSAETSTGSITFNNWNTLNLQSAYSASANSYIVCARGEAGNANYGNVIYLTYDYGQAGWTGFYQNDNADTSIPAALNGTAYDGQRYSIYATYTASGGGSPAPTPPMLIID